MFTPDQMQSSKQIHFQTKEIEDSLKNDGLYIKDSITIRQLNDFDQYRKENDYSPEEDYVFALQNTDKQTPFIGVVNYYLKREGYCLNTYLNGDIYFGYYKNDLRNKQGIYAFKPKNIENNILSQFYYGEWENDLFKGKGIYLWLKEEDHKDPFSDFKNSNFDAFVGYSVEGKFQKGALLSKKGYNKYIYYGSFSQDGKKEGKNCFYYSSHSEKLCFGTFKDNIFTEGYVGKFKKEKVTQLIAYKKEENKDDEGERISLKNEKKITENLKKFREVILKKYYFNMIYEEFERILKFRDEKMNNIETILTDKYAEVMNCFQFNKISLCEDIERNIDL